MPQGCVIDLWNKVLCVYVFGVQFCQAQSPPSRFLTMVKKAVNHLMVRLATKKAQPGDPVRSQVIPKEGDPFKAKAEAKTRALSSDALAEALAKGQRREAEMVAAQKAREEEADEAWRNWARRQDLSPVGAPPSK